MFGTALNYVALRILGMSAEHPVTVKARATLHRLGNCFFRRTYQPALIGVTQVERQVLPLGESFGCPSSMSTIGKDSIPSLPNSGACNIPNAR